MEYTHPAARPILPLDLEREIFEIVAFQRPIRKFDGLINLMLVAHRVHDWIKPFLYNVMMKANSSVAHNYPPSHHGTDSDNPTPLPFYPQYGIHIRHLLIQNVDAGEAMRILRCCPNVHDVGIWMIEGPRHEFRTILSSMPIQRLSVNVDYLFRISDAPKGRQFAIDHTIFTHLTHLEALCTGSLSWQDWQRIMLIPTLSYLSIDRFDKELVERILQHSPSTLELLIVILDRDRGIYTKDDLGGQLNDQRLVLLLSNYNWIEYLDEWEKGAHGQTDLWMTGKLKKERKIPFWKQYLHRSLPINQLKGFVQPPPL